MIALLLVLLLVLLLASIAVNLYLQYRLFDSRAAMMKMESRMDQMQADVKNTKQFMEWYKTQFEVKVKETDRLHNAVYFRNPN